MALPQTACLALPGPLGPVPGTPHGRAWFSEEDEAEVEEVQASLALPFVSAEVHGCGVKPLLDSADVFLRHIIWV